MPKGSISTTFRVDAGLHIDLDNFCKTFLENDIVLYEDFKELFFSENMDSIFNCRSELAELVEFNQFLLSECTKYLHDSHTSLDFRTKLFGLYTMYTFYYLQPDNSVTQIRVTPDVLTELEWLMNGLLLPRNQLDAYTCALKLIEDDAFRVTSFMKIHDPMSCQNSMEVNPRINKNNEKILKQPNPFGGIEDFLRTPMVLQLIEVHKIYEQMSQSLNYDEYHTEIENPELIFKSIIQRQKMMMIEDEKLRKERTFVLEDEKAEKEKPEDSNENYPIDTVVVVEEEEQFAYYDDEAPEDDDEDDYSEIYD